MIIFDIVIQYTMNANVEPRFEDYVFICTDFYVEQLYECKYAIVKLEHYKPLINEYVAKFEHFPVRGKIDSNFQFIVYIIQDICRMVNIPEKLRLECIHIINMYASHAVMHNFDVELVSTVNRIVEDSKALVVESIKHLSSVYYHYVNYIGKQSFLPIYSLSQHMKRISEIHNIISLYHFLFRHIVSLYCKFNNDDTAAGIPELKQYRTNLCAVEVTLRLLEYSILDGGCLRITSTVNGSNDGPTTGICVRRELYDREKDAINLIRAHTSFEEFDIMSYRTFYSMFCHRTFRKPSLTIMSKYNQDSRIMSDMVIDKFLGKYNDKRIDTIRKNVREIWKATYTGKRCPIYEEEEEEDNVEEEESNTEVEENAGNDGVDTNVNTSPANNNVITSPTTELEDNDVGVINNPNLDATVTPYCNIY